MKKTLSYGILGVVLLVGLVVTLYYGLQPRAIQLIRISQFDNERVIANSVLLRMRQEFQTHPILLVGIEPGKPGLALALNEFVKMNQDPATIYPLFMVDHELEIASPELTGTASRSSTAPCATSGWARVTTES